MNSGANKYPVPANDSSGRPLRDGSVVIELAPPVDDATADAEIALVKAQQVTDRRGRGK